MGTYVRTQYDSTNDNISMVLSMRICNIKKIRRIRFLLVTSGWDAKSLAKRASRPSAPSPSSPVYAAKRGFVGGSASDRTSATPDETPAWLSGSGGSLRV